MMECSRRTWPSPSSWPTLQAEVSMKAFGRADLRVETKADGSPVTEVDGRIEEVLREELARHLPG